MTLTYRQKRALQAFRASAREFSLEQAVISARKSVRMPEADWLDPEPLRTDGRHRGRAARSRRVEGLSGGHTRAGSA